MEGLIELIMKNGLPTVVMALIAMTLVGFVKIFTKGIVVKKEHSENATKWLAKLYLLLALVFSMGVAMLYYAFILKADFISFECAKCGLVVFTVTSPLYQIYKQFGGRKLLVAITSLILKLFKGKNKKADEIIDIVMSILGDDAPYLTDVQKEAIKADLEKKFGLGSKEAKTKAEVSNA